MQHWDNRWQRPPGQPLTLRSGAVHLWCADLDLPDSTRQQMNQWLSADEQERRDRKRFLPDQQRFTAARGILRSILSRYLHQLPQEIRFAYGERGKPYLAVNSAETAANQIASQSVTPSTNWPAVPLFFNISHSHQLMLCAIADQPQIGIDVEHLRAVPAMKLAERYFLPSEQQWLRRCSPDQQERDFLILWTCKEAYLKATGVGISRLSQVEIVRSHDHLSLHLFAPGIRDAAVAAAWEIQSFQPQSNYVAAFAAEQSIASLGCWWWHPADEPNLRD